MARLPTPNQDEGIWGSVLNDYLSVSHEGTGELRTGVVTNATVSSTAAIDQAKISGLSASLAAKADAASVATELNGKAATGHTHVIADVSGLQSALDSKANAGSGGANSLDALTDVNTAGAQDGNALVYTAGTWVPGAVGGNGSGSTPADNSVSAIKLTTDAVTTVKIVDGAITNAKISSSAAIDQAKIAGLATTLSGKANTTHTHTTADITSGVFGTARLGTGTASSTTFLRGDGTWATPAGGSGGTVTSNDITDATTTGKAVLTSASAAAARTAIGAGTSNITIGTTTGTALDGSNAATIAGKVTGTNISIINKLTQAQYDALSSKVATTLYVIVG